ncbi:MAG: hypothetical protein PHW10_02725 [Candidatus Peribacteraceae bacterium]|nr:hypothetical protein [Candidatus Peribacteraceae bacterium]
MVDEQKSSPDGGNEQEFVELSPGILPPAITGDLRRLRKALLGIFEGGLTSRQIEKLTALQRRIDAKEIAPERMDLNDLDMIMNQAGEPLTRSVLGDRAVVLFPDEFEQLVALDIVLPNGERTLIEPERLSADDVLILYPEDLGESGK